jgi:protein TonB
VVNPQRAPVEAAAEIKPEPPPPPPPTMGVVGVSGGIPGGTRAASSVALRRRRLRRRQPRRCAWVATSRSPRRSGRQPVYPQIAQTAKIQGIVIIEATIGKDGSVKDAKVLRSQAMLDQAALDAVRQWKFTPTLLNGQPVEVIMTVTVNFTLN